MTFVASGSAVAGHEVRGEAFPKEKCESAILGTSTLEFVSREGDHLSGEGFVDGRQKERDRRSRARARPTTFETATRTFTTLAGATLTTARSRGSTALRAPARSRHANGAHPHVHDDPGRHAYDGTLTMLDGATRTRTLTTVVA